MRFKDLFKNVDDYEKIKSLIGNVEGFEKEFETKELDLIPYGRFKDVNDQMRESKKNNEELNKKLEKLTKESITPEMFEEKTKNLIDEHKNKMTEIETKYMNLKKEYAVKDSLAKVGAKYPDLIIHRLDMNKIIEREGKFEGIDDQIKGLKETYKDLFSDSPSVSSNESVNLYEGIKSSPLNEGGGMKKMFADTFWDGVTPSKN